MDLGGAGIFDIYNTSKSGFVASYQESFKHTAIYFPIINELLHSNVVNDCRMTPTSKSFIDERTQLICQANELGMPTHSPDVEREAIKLRYSFSQILTKLSHENFRGNIKVVKIMRPICYTPLKKRPMPSFVPSHTRSPSP
jgi:hypothetical protein